ncbi:DMT family transporter [Lyngbya confervoides]|uniref:DMT family transporter n=1 Tax=Lyngbya confervoides BDU141951 TaxID=1574623 RepID=A0ABD4T6Z6_9CYAN|nr:DMT family transporter [Lyngbya confervoides]MCM1984248.1 DMT family transporter [Lyngbya confervoides BDU141951]
MALLLTCMFGGNQVASKIALDTFPPLLCGAWAFSLATLSLGIYAQRRRVQLCPPSRQVWAYHARSALLFLGFNAVALVGLQLTLASRASIFIALHPFFVIIFNQLIRRDERIGPGQLVGLALATVGVLLVLSDRLQGDVGTSGAGDGLLLLSAALLGLSILQIRQVTHYVSALQATFWQIGLTVPAFWIGSLLLEAPLRLSYNLLPWTGIIYMGLGNYSG